MQDTVKKTIKVVVFGGNGFLGSQICRNLLRKEVDVISISRSGRPPSRLPWCEKVTWLKGNALNPSELPGLLRDSDGCINTIGTFFENQTYKEILGKTSGYKTRPQDSTFSKINFEAAVNIAKTVSITPSCRIHAFISAAVPPCMPNIPYVSSKRAAEKEILKLLSPPLHRPLIFRPGFLYSESKPFLAALAYGLNWSQTALSLFLSSSRSSSNLKKPLPVSVVSSVVAHSVLNQINLNLMNSSSLSSQAPFLCEEMKETTYLQTVMEVEHIVEYASHHSLV
eukprot:Sdes_comp20620_c1_seq1m15692